MKFFRRFLGLSFLILSVSLVSSFSPSVVLAEYAFDTNGWPSATIKVTDSKGVSNKDLIVCPGDKVNYQVSGSFGTVGGDDRQFMGVFLRKAGTSGNKLIQSSSSNPNVSGTLDTTGLAEGLYTLSMYGNKGDFGCEGNPSCQYFCGRDSAQGHIDAFKNKSGHSLGPVSCNKDSVDGGSCKQIPAFTDLDYYRHTGYPPTADGYPGYCNGGIDIGGSQATENTCKCTTQGGTAQKINANSCGEPSIQTIGGTQTNTCGNGCELVACDRAGNNDYALITITASCGGASPGPSASLTPGTTPRPSGTPRPSVSPRPSASPGIPAAAKFIAAGPNVCLDKNNPKKVAVVIDWESNDAYSAYAITRRTCISFTNCNNDEALLSDFIPASGNEIMSFPDMTISPTRVVDFFQYRVWGQLKGQQKPATPIGQWDSRFWSRPLTVQIDRCDSNEGGLKLKEYKIEVEPSASPAK